ncbi:ABC transporter ATP-binding protein [Mycoplasmatota bacterium]|nr:ABC transporter ATP-binding protein [Mycoplasmatota bacterium]
MLRKFIRYYSKHKLLLVIDLAASSLVAILSLIFPGVTRVFIDDLIPNKKLDQIFTYALLLIGLYIIRSLLSFVIEFWGHVMGTRIERDMRSDLFKKLQLLDVDYFDENKTGAIMTKLVGNLRDISEMAHHAPETIFVSSIMIIGSFVLLIRISPLFTGVIFTFILFLIIYMMLRRKKMMESFRSTRQTHANINSQVESSVGGVRLTKAYTNEAFEIDKFNDINESYQHSWRDAYFQMGVFSSGTSFIIDMINVTVLALGAFFVANNKISLGSYTSYFLYMNFIMQPIRRLVMMMQQIQRGWSGYEKFHAIMKIKPRINSKENALPLTNPKGQIEFKNVTFKYNKSNSDVLKDFNMKINPGQKIAIVGETGVGKSTISKIIPRFYEVDEGSVLVDGIDVKDYDLFTLRNSIGHVQQDVYIFWGSVMDNVLYGDPFASKEDVYDACKKANIHEFIISLENGYDTLVGERGVKLSGGQKQRISIARLFLKNPSILILDEATSSLDNVTEKLIQESLDALAIGRTTIVIAHRLSTIINSDQILVLTDKGIDERGTHEELIEIGGYYAKLHKI